MANPLLEKINHIVTELTRLDVVTVVGAASVTVDSESNIKFNLPNDTTPRAMITRVNLVSGDVQNVIHPDFVAGDLASMRDFHTAQVTQGHEVIVNNIKALRELALDLGDKLKA